MLKDVSLEDLAEANRALIYNKTAFQPMMTESFVTAIRRTPTPLSNGDRYAPEALSVREPRCCTSSARATAPGDRRPARVGREDH